MRFEPDFAVTEVSVPSKLMLLGEYGVLLGLPAIVTTLPPRFRMSAEKSSGSPVHSFHEKSAAGRWLKQAGNQTPIEFDFSDAHEGRGGFGGSTAEFALSFLSLRPDASVQSVWKEYRSLEPRSSGADLIAQLMGGTVAMSYASRFEGDAGEVTVAQLCENAGIQSVLDRMQVFSATHQRDRKVRTHEELERVHGELFRTQADAVRSRLQSILERALDSIRSGSTETFGETMTEYAEALSGFGLEAEASRDDRREFLKICDVLGCKGVGAGLADVMIVLTDGGPETTRAVSEIAKARDLREISVRGSLGKEAGFTRHMAAAGVRR